MKLARNAFTLVELLIVIGLTAILISLLLPALQSVRRSAQNLQCQTNLRTYGQTIFIYTTDFGGRLPHSYALNYDPHAWAYYLANRYRLSRGVPPNGDATRWIKNEATSDIVQCPSDTVSVRQKTADNWGKYMSYIANGNILQPFPKSRQLSVHGNASRRGLIFEKPGILSNSSYITVESWRSFDQASQHLEYRHAGGRNVSMQSDERLTVSGGGARREIMSARMNVLYLDGHIDSVSRKEMEHQLLTINNGKNQRFRGIGEAISELWRAGP